MKKIVMTGRRMMIVIWRKKKKEKINENIEENILI